MFVKIILVGILGILFAGCATVCPPNDQVCKEKQTAEYARPFYNPLPYGD